MIQDRIHLSGTRILVETTAAADVAAVGVWYDRGSRHESPGEAGSTHMVEHMLFKGTQHLSASDIARRFDSLGGAANAFTERECMGLYCVIPSDSFEEAMEVLLSLVTDASFDPQEFEREKSVILNELETAEDDPEEAATDAFMAQLWPKHSLGRNIGGDRKAVSLLQRDRVYSIYEKHFRAKPTLISVAGGVDTERVLKAMDKANISMEQTNDHEVYYPPVDQGAIGFFYHPLSVQYVQLFYGAPILGHLDEQNYYPLEIANAALGDSMGSRLFQELRERLGLCYSIYSTATLFQDCSLWSVYGTCSTQDALALFQVLQGEIERVKREGLREDEIVTAKEHLCGMVKIASQDAEYRMRRMARQALYGSPIHSLEDTVKAIQGVDLSMVNTILLQYLTQDPILFAAGPRRGRSKLNTVARKLRVK